MNAKSGLKSKITHHNTIYITRYITIFFKVIKVNVYLQNEFPYSKSSRWLYRRII